MYLVFELEKSVRALLQACSHDPLSPDGLSEYYFKMSSRRMRCKEVSTGSSPGPSLAYEASFLGVGGPAGCRPVCY